MRNIPVNLGGFKLMVTEAPVMKMREDGNGELVPVLAYGTNEQQFVVSVFAKRRPREDGGRVGKGEEIKVTLSADPGDGFDEGTYVELIDATTSPWAMKDDQGNVTSGLSFKAAGLKPAGQSGLSSAA
ncbi:hypothetical protein BAY61_11755 [Prauserella marina]|uniref:Uncharacterized protein n=1 Tax=Prauserella marina TaxID=530584 RepID=A0A222VNR4_9PSEU|nr:hypothetical protein [Prauserella marina]ASR35559.1 hypothetical protein BAY61_11755 [Prauserella marina]PWV84594.1 hypothetical protein DES30_101611 [Prauserella marina]SDC18287.1 hypothetical protein SAMN05421630_101725 [Prauserella marina]